jgi:hypothetical protein
MCSTEPAYNYAQKEKKRKYRSTQIHGKLHSGKLRNSYFTESIMVVNMAVIRIFKTFQTCYGDEVKDRDMRTEYQWKP